MNLSVEHVTAGYGSKPVIFDISLALASGEVLCLLGANGSGKTTLFKAILGLLKPGAGKVCVDGEDISHWPRQRLAKTLGYVPQAHRRSAPCTVRLQGVKCSGARVLPLR
jgi:ABC-type cobalamin/Fe3+-siderophores transport system ATPase subunit